MNCFINAEYNIIQYNNAYIEAEKGVTHEHTIHLLTSKVHSRF